MIHNFSKFFEQMRQVMPGNEPIHTKIPDSVYKFCGVIMAYKNCIDPDYNVSYDELVVLVDFCDGKYDYIPELKKYKELLDLKTCREYLVELRDARKINDRLEN